jgi:cell division protein FtsW
MTFQLKNHLKGDRHIWLILFLLCITSTAVVYSSISALAFKSHGGNTEMVLFKHIFFLCLGCFFAFIIHKIDITDYLVYARIGLIVCVFLLIYTLLFGVSVGGAKRWIRVLGQTIQTSDIIKLVLITNLSAMLAKRQNIDYRPRDIFWMILWIGFFVGGLAISSFSTAIILGLTCFIIMWIGKVPSKYLLSLMGILVLIVTLSVFGGIMLKRATGMEVGRFATVIDRVEDYVGKDLDGNHMVGGEEGVKSNQKAYALSAIAVGGLIGTGPGNSALKNFLPDAFSDFVYSIVCEEYGIWGGIWVLVLFLWLLYRGLHNINNTNRAFTGLLSVGLTLSIVVQAFAHICINVGIFPVTGQTLPLISQGGTSAIFTCMAIGIVLSVTKSQENP